MASKRARLRRRREMRARRIDRLEGSVDTVSPPQGKVTMSDPSRSPEPTTVQGELLRRNHEHAAEVRREHARAADSGHNDAAPGRRDRPGRLVARVTVIRIIAIIVAAATLGTLALASL